MSNKVLIPEKDLDDETIKRFLVGIMLTDEWADEFNPVHIAITFAHETNVYTPHISTYLHGIKKLLKNHSNPDYEYTLSLKGKRWLDKFNKGENNDK
tara:strand:- start:1594 stop:1884 length:291 start_codon:yes stop_codon:yes gene_type:complete